ncbi:MAG: UDP-N-acetylglucosamine 1-carboxyvinyltransferase, partial [Candidatus Paceibacterota bacterium]
PTTVRVKGRQPVFSALDIKTHEYPGFPTDLQAPMAVFLTQSAGQSYIFETIFEGRLNYLETLGQMGAEARIIDVHRALITGPTPLAGREMESPDLRAGLAYLLAGLVADGQSVVHNVYYIDRGYQEIDKRLQAIGADITRVKG